MTGCWNDLEKENILVIEMKLIDVLITERMYKHKLEQLKRIKELSEKGKKKGKSSSSLLKG